MARPIDTYFANMKRWREEAAALRPILLACGLDEEIKWGKPCYAVDGHNLAIVQPMKAFLALMFFEGALLEDAKGVLEKQGERSRAATRRSRRATATHPCRPTSRRCRAGSATSGAN